MTKVIRLRNIKRALRLEPSEAISYIISGRVNSFRSYKSFNFIDLIDGSTQRHIQVTVKKNLLDKPELGSFITCQGNIVPSPGCGQETEFRVDKLNYLGKCDPGSYPLASAKDRLTDEWYRQHIHLRPRTSHFSSLLRVRSELELSLHMIMKQMDFFRVHTPTLTANDSEASSDLFSVQRSRMFSRQANVAVATISSDSDDSDDNQEENKSQVEEKGSQDICSQDSGNDRQRVLVGNYFKKDVFMVTSAQLHLESLAASLSRVYCLSPCFRAENSLSQRHLCEFQMFEAEESNLTDLEPLMNRVESIIKFVAQFLCEVSEYKSDFISLLDRNSNHQVYKKLVDSRYIRMSYEEALRVLEARRSNSETKMKTRSTSYGCDIGRWHERQLLEHCDNVPIFITNYPRRLKPFYMKCDDNNEVAQCFDLIAPFGGEICGGSLREDNLERLQASLGLCHQWKLPQFVTTDKLAPGHSQSTEQQQQEQLKHFQWYVDLRRFGSFPHGGFGIGFERLVQSLLGVKSIKDTIAFPRWPGQCPM